MQSCTVDLGVPVHYADFGGEGSTPFVLVHGLGGSFVNWMAVGPLLAKYGRCVALDLAGFGYTPGDNVASTLENNRLLLDRFLREVTGRALVFGNSMGGLLAAQQAAYCPSTVAGLVLSGPALLAPKKRQVDLTVVSTLGMLMVPGLGEYYAKRRKQKSTPKQLVDENMLLCASYPQLLPKDALEAHYRVAEKRFQFSWSDKAYLTAARSLLKRMLLHPHSMENDLKKIVAPVLLLHGQRDRLVPISVARRVAVLRPSWEVQEIEDLGHVLQLECPEEFVNRAMLWWSTIQSLPTTLQGTAAKTVESAAHL